MQTVHMILYIYLDHSYRLIAFTFSIYTSTHENTAEWEWFITVTSSLLRWRHKSPAWRLFTQLFIQAQIKENIKAPRHWPLWGEYTGDR